MSDEQTVDELYNADYRAASGRWWKALAGVEGSVIIVLAGLGLVGGSSSDGKLPWELWVERLSRLAETVSFSPASEEGRISFWVPLGLLATLGIATTVALNSALDRTERAWEAKRSDGGALPAVVFRLRFAEIGQNAIFIVAMGALALCHLFVFAAASKAHTSVGDERVSALIATVFSMFMLSFFVVECARLAAPFKTPLLSRPRDVDENIRKRLVAKVRRGRKRSRLQRVVSTAMVTVVFAAGVTWLIRPEFLGVSVAPGSDAQDSAAVFLAGTVVIVGLGAAVGTVTEDSLLESWGSRVWTVGGSVLLYVMGALTLALLLLTSNPAWEGWADDPAKLIAVLILHLVLVVAVLVKLLGRAGIGPDSGRAIERVLRARRARRRASSKRVWWTLVVLAAMQALGATVGGIGVAQGEMGGDAIGFSALLFGVGMWGTIVGLLACGEAESKTSGVARMPAHRCMQIGGLVAFGIVALASQAIQGWWSLLFLVWVMLALTPLGLSVWTVRSLDLPARGARRAFRRLGDHLMALSIGSARRRIAQRIAPEEDWDDAKVLRWLRDLMEEAKDGASDVRGRSRPARHVSGSSGVSASGLL